MTTPDTAITRKRYDELRLQVIGEWGLPAGDKAVTWPPTGLTVMKRLGDGYWADALRNIGLTPSPKGRSRGLLKYTEEAYASAISDYFAYSNACGHAPSIEGYERWVDFEDRAGHSRPSWGAVRLRYKTWTNVLRVAVTSPCSQAASKVNRVPHSTRALHDAQSAWKRFVEELRATPQAKAPAAVRTFVRSYVEEFEFRRRNWLRAAASTDADAVKRVLAGEYLPKKQRLALTEGAALAEVLTDKYIDRLGAGDPRVNDGWLRSEAQAELDSVPDEVALQFKALREVRNYFTHTSVESQKRVRTTIDALTTLDPRFTINKAVTTRTLTDWLRAKDLQRLRLLCGSVQELWRAMVVGEVLLDAQ